MAPVDVSTATAREIRRLDAVQRDVGGPR
jgi:hypothetical protein